MIRRKRQCFRTAIGTHQKLEAETSAEIPGVFGIKNDRILRQRSAGSLRRGSDVLCPQKLPADL